MFEESLIERLDATAEAQEKGRSAVLRRLAGDYLRELRRQEIQRRYASAYGDGAALGDDFDGWDDQGRWPSG